jgi:hypothetical protein
MSLPYLLIIVLIIIVAVSLALAAFKGKSSLPKEILDEETDGLIFDHEAGKYVTVEELVAKHQLEVIDDTKIQQVYDALSIEIKQDVGLKEVAAILESRYQFKTLAAEEEELPGEDYMMQVIYDGFQKKGKNITKENIIAVLKVYEQAGSAL